MSQSLSFPGRDLIPVLEQEATVGDRVWPKSNHRFATVIDATLDWLTLQCDCSRVFRVPRRHAHVIPKDTPIAVQALAPDLLPTSHARCPRLSWLLP
jgi:hypothetical protein